MVIPGAGEVLGAATKGASAAAQTVVRGVQTTGQIVKGAHKAVSVVNTVSSGKSKRG
jgi:hypothetical protein